MVECGALEHDREFALFDADGKYVNGKRNPKVHQLLATIEWKEATIYLKLRNEPETFAFHLHKEIAKLETWLGGYFEMPVFWKRNSRGGFPDDTKAPGPTVIGISTLESVTGWYEGLSVSEIRTRFRANLEIADSEPFWEDRLYAEPEQVVRFRVGDVELEGTNPCQRCVVPTRDTATGELTPDFSNTFMEKRKAHLPTWAAVSRFNHYYRLAVNTRVPQCEVGKLLRVGDEIEILGVRAA
jgi:uncharacterized protein YcbX